MTKHSKVFMPLYALVLVWGCSCKPAAQPRAPEGQQQPGVGGTQPTFNTGTNTTFPGGGTQGQWSDAPGTTPPQGLQVINLSGLQVRGDNNQSLTLTQILDQSGKRKAVIHSLQTS